MPDFARVRSSAQHALFVGVAIVGLAHLPPLHLAQRLDSALLDVFAGWLAQPVSGSIRVVSLGRADSLPALSADSHATIIGPTALAIGPLRGSVWVSGAAWAAAILGVAALAGTRLRRRRLAPLLGAAGTGLLLTASATGFAIAGAWIPVAGPALLLLIVGSLVARRERAALRASTDSLPARATGAELLRRGDLVDAWHAYRGLQTTSELLPELHALGESLADRGYPELAADAFMRVAQVDPEYRDVAKRLAGAGREDAFADEAERELLRREMPPRVGRYRMLEPVGRGTTGRVYLACDLPINRLVAIKLIDLSDERDEIERADARERFLREAETAGRLVHPNIVTIFDVGESDGRTYIAMEYLKGDLLRSFTSPDRLLPPRLVLDLCALAADALDYAHSRNVIHRDIKPANIMYDSVSGDLKITDFGIARLIDVNRTRTGVVLGTPSFMSPEQIEGGNVKGHTDIFALGVSLYELLTGRLPFRGTSMTNLMFVIANEPHERLSAVRSGLPAALDTLIDRALCKAPGGRFARGAEMAAALRSVARQLA